MRLTHGTAFAAPVRQGATAGIIDVGISPSHPLPLPDRPLGDGTVALRGWSMVDARPLAAAGRDPWIRRFRGSIPADDDAARVWLAAAEGRRLRGDRLELAIIDAAGKSLLGGVTLWDVRREHRSAMINYWVAPGARGRGIASRAVRLLAAWSFDGLDVARLQAFIDPDNVASQRVAERCGFVHEGTLRSHMVSDGRRRGTLVFGLLTGELR